MDPSAAPSFALQLAGALTRLGFDEQARQQQQQQQPASPLPCGVPRAELVRELEWVEGALGQLRPEQRHALATLLQALHARHALTPEQMRTYASLQESQRAISDPQGLQRRLEALGVDDEAEEEEDLEDIEREIAALEAEESTLVSRISSLELSRSQYDARRLQVSERRAEMERAMDDEAERAKLHDKAAQKDTSGQSRAAPTLARASNRIHSAAEISAHLAALNGDCNRTLRSLESAAKQIDALLKDGRYTPPDAATGRVARNRQHQGEDSRATASHRADQRSAYTALPSLAADELSAFDVDSTGGASLLSAAAAAAASSTATSAATHSQSHPAHPHVVADASDSPLVLHHPSLLAAYVSLDDAWARSLNAFFRAQFGASPTSNEAPAQDKGATGANRMQQTMRMLQADEAASHEMLSLLHQTPHAKHLRTPATLARGKIAPRTQHRDREAQQQTTGHFDAPPKQISFSTPPSSHSASRAGAGSASSAPLTSSSLSASVHASYSAELSRLYASFPESQSYWLLSNLHFVGVRARVQQQHAAMVAEEQTRRLTRQQLNEAIAEAAIQQAALGQQLAALLRNDDAGAFPSLWGELRGLQLLEVLRVDLDFKFQRQDEYVDAQRRVVGLLLEQKARHELLLAAQRWGLDRLQRLRDLAHAAWTDLATERRRLDARTEGYAHLRGLHTATAAMHAPSRLAVDARAGLLARAERMASSAMRSVQRGQSVASPPTASAATAAATAVSAADSHRPSPGTSPASSAFASYDALLTASQSLSGFQPRFAAAVAAQSSARQAHLAALAASAARTRALLFDDGTDVCVGGGDAADGSASPGALTPAQAAAANDARLSHGSFAQLLSRTERAVDTAASALNSLLQQQAQQSAPLRSPGVCVERDLRPVWREFIQAPDLLDQRVRRMQQQLKEAEARSS